jgi:hypothetical protein
MGGQACVFYGAAEFSRDTDIVLLLDPDNLRRLGAALKDLDAECIAVPPFDPDYLRRGHAVHFRCRTPEASGIRLDVMAAMRRDADAIAGGLQEEEVQERKRDNAFWLPLVRELEALRHAPRIERR